MPTTQATPKRDDYGALYALPAAQAETARDLLAKAISSGKLRAEYSDLTNYGGRCIGWALNYSIYDVTPSAVLVQRRKTECTHYGMTPHKDYFIIRRCGRGVRVTEAAKARVVKLANVSTAFGQVIDTLEGRAKKPLKQASTAPADGTRRATCTINYLGHVILSYDEGYSDGVARTERTFMLPHGSWYVLEERNGEWKQVCERLSDRGNTLMCSGGPHALQALIRQEYRAMRRA